MTLKEFVEKTDNGHIFTVAFIKRTTGEERVMNCRRGVHAHLRGGAPAYDAKSKNLLTVYDIQKEGYRTVNLDSLLWLNFDGHAYIWEGGEFKET